ncbi:MAG: hypothetical protein AB1422_00135 [bacterium]
MKKIRKLLVTAFVLSVIATPMSAWAINDLCWNINGWYIKVTANYEGSYLGNQIWSLHGKGPAGPCEGTALLPVDGSSISVSVELLQAGNAYAVMHQATLNPNTLSGTGYWRWFDSSAAGSSTWTFTAPVPWMPAETKGDLTSAGVK